MGRFRLGTASMSRLATCHPLLQEVIEEAILRTPLDFTVLEGWRGQKAQDAAFKAGNSTKPWPKSLHNHTEAGKPLSLAVDVAPWFATAPHVRWNQTNEFRWLAGFIMGVGARIVEPRGFRLRWGGRFNERADHSHQKFVDLPHVELVPL